MSQASCDSCGMPIDQGRYCQHCADGDGRLHGFEETVARMSEFMRRQDPTLTEDDAHRRTVAHMAKMPAWRDHERLKTLLSI
jgi:hypothetical protein